jgi:hypothetical protein
MTWGLMMAAGGGLPGAAWGNMVICAGAATAHTNTAHAIAERDFMQRLLYRVGEYAIEDRTTVSAYPTNAPPWSTFMLV